MRLCRKNSGFKLVEVMFTTVLVSALGLIIYSILSTDTVLGAKNSAMNTAHQQARTAMLQMLQDLHSAVSLPYLIDANRNPIPTPSPGASASPAPGIAFQQWSSGPHKIKEDADAGSTASPQKIIHLVVTSGQATPAVGQRLNVPTHQIESDIDAVSGNASDLTVTLHDNLPVAISGTHSSVGDVVCFITDRCSYTVVNNALDWRGPTTHNTFAVMGSNITNSQGIIDPSNPPKPFSIPTTAAGAPYYRFVAAIDLSTSDLKYNNRGYKSANILLNGQVPMKARLTTYTGAPTPTPTP